MGWGGGGGGEYHFVQPSIKYVSLAMTRPDLVSRSVFPFPFDQSEMRYFNHSPACGFTVETCTYSSTVKIHRCLNITFLDNGTRIIIKIFNVLRDKKIKILIFEKC